MKRKNVVAGLLAFAGVLLAIFFTMTLFVHVNASASDGANKCTITANTAYHNEAGVPKGQYGKTQTFTVNDLKPASDRFLAKFCNSQGQSDLVFAASIIEVHKTGVNPTTAATAQKEAAGWKNDLKTANAAISAYTSGIKGFDIAADNDPKHSYDTFGMESNGTDLPKLVFLHESHPAVLTLIVHFKDGSADELVRIVCDFQPEATNTPPSPSTPTQKSTPDCHTNNTCPGTPATDCHTNGTCPPPDCHTNGTCPKTSPPPDCHTSGTCPTTKTCESVYGPSSSGNYPDCHKDGSPSKQPTQPTQAPGPNPSPNPTNNPGSNQCYSDSTGQAVQPVNGKCPPGSSG